MDIQLIELMDRMTADAIARNTELLTRQAEQTIAATELVDIGITPSSAAVITTE